MTIKDYLERNNKIKQIAEENEIDIEKYHIELSSLASNFTFVLDKQYIRDIKPNKQGRIITEMQICYYRPCVITSIDYKNLDKYLEANNLNKESE